MRQDVARSIFQVNDVTVAATEHMSQLMIRETYPLQFLDSGKERGMG